MVFFLVMTDALVRFFKYCFEKNDFFGGVKLPGG